MTYDLNCLSALELLDVLDGRVDQETAAHAAECPRCHALLAAVRADDAVVVPAPARVRRGRARAAVRGKKQPGELWRAAAGSERVWVVALLSAGAAIALVPEPELAAHPDIPVGAEGTGYPGFLDVHNHGILADDQLLECVGRLTDADVRRMIAHWQFVTGVGPAPPDTVAVPVVGNEDPRLLARAERAEQLAHLWQAPASATTRTADRPGLAVLIRGRVDGPEADWDRPGLLEASGADGGRLDAFLDDHLDLTDRRDVDDLARVLRALDVGLDDVQEAVVVTLRRSAGGRRRADGPGVPMAARSTPGADADEVTRRLYADQTEIDASEQARELEIAGYLADLRRAYDDLG